MLFRSGYIVFGAIHQAPAEGYIREIPDIAVGHTYCIVTSEEKYAKINIIEFEYGNRQTGEAYAWIRFQWQYQPDGTRDFEELPDWMQ